MSSVPLECSYCSKPFLLSKAEYNRQVRKGRERFFCSRSCSAKYGNDNRENRTREIEKTCPYCDKSFKTRTGKTEATFCSRGCASAGSVTKYRREKAREMGSQNVGAINDIAVIAKGLRTRESWKYEELKKFFLSRGERFEPEYPLGRYVFDLALPDRKLFLEFDGKDHEWTVMAQKDAEKDEFAESKGWKVVRIRVNKNTRFSVAKLLAAI